MDETYIKIKGQWLYYYRAVDTKTILLISFYLQNGIPKQLMHFLQKP